MRNVQPVLVVLASKTMSSCLDENRSTMLKESTLHIDEFSRSQTLLDTANYFVQSASNRLESTLLPFLHQEIKNKSIILSNQ